MSTLLRKRISANQGEHVPDSMLHNQVSFCVTDELRTPGPAAGARSHVITETPMSVDESAEVAMSTRSWNTAETPISRCKRQRGDEWPKERLVLEYQKLMKLRIQASIATADAAEAHKRAVAASGSVVEQERSILVNVAKRAQRAFHRKQETLEMYVEQYEKSRTDSKHALDQVDAMKSAVEAWTVQLTQRTEDDGIEVEIAESPCHLYARALP